MESFDQCPRFRIGFGIDLWCGCPLRVRKLQAAHVAIFGRPTITGPPVLFRSCRPTQDQGAAYPFAEFPSGTSAPAAAPAG